MNTIKGRVLFIGDNLDIGNLMNRILNRAGCISSFCSPQEAFSILVQNHFDCILIDWVLESDRIVAFCKRTCSLVPQASIFLFTGVASREAVKPTVDAIGEKRLAIISLDGLVAMLYQQPEGERSRLSALL